MHTRNAGGMTQVLDGETGEIRDAGRADLVDFTRLMDGLDDIDFVAPGVPLRPSLRDRGIARSGGDAEPYGQAHQHTGPHQKESPVHRQDG